MKDYIAVAGLCIVAAAFFLLLGTIISKSWFWIGMLSFVFLFAFYVWIQPRL
jgi:hypothetical protein